MDSAIDRRMLVKGMAAAGLTAGALCAGTRAARPALAGAPEAESPPAGAVSVKEHGGVGDGRTPEADTLQGILDRVAAHGGGVVVFPPGRYVLEKTLLIPSDVHIVGHGRQTVFQGSRPGDIHGYALIANAGITTAEGYDGAHDFSVQNVAIDSPRTNGIVLVHARNAYFSRIYGLDAHHHHFDIAGCKNIVTENLFLTGRSGTAPYQIDGSPFYNNTWDGQTNLQPIQDGTPNDGIFLSNSVIHPTNRPNHGIHFHRDNGKNIFIDNVLVEHLGNGIFRDPNCHRTDVHITNVVIKDVSQRGIHFRETDKPDQRVSISGVVIQKVAGPGFVQYEGCEGLTLRNLKAVADDATGSQRVVLRNIDRGVVDDVQVCGAGSGSALWLQRCRHFLISNVIAQHVSRSLRLEQCTNISYSGITELAADGAPLEKITIEGRQCLAPWNHS